MNFEIFNFIRGPILDGKINLRINMLCSLAAFWWNLGTKMRKKDGLGGIKCGRVCLEDVLSRLGPSWAYCANWSRLGDLGLGQRWAKKV